MVKSTGDFSEGSCADAQNEVASPSIALFAGCCSWLEEATTEALAARFFSASCPSTRAAAEAMDTHARHERRYAFPRACGRHTITTHLRKHELPCRRYLENVATWRSTGDTKNVTKPLLLILLAGEAQEDTTARHADSTNATRKLAQQPLPLDRRQRCSPHDRRPSRGGRRLRRHLPPG